MSPDVSNPAAREITYDELFTDVCEQVDGLIEGGADVILIETIFDTLNCKAMIDAALTMMKKHGVELPVMIDLTVSDAAGRTLNGQTVDAFACFAFSLSYLLCRHELRLWCSSDEAFHRTHGSGCTLLY